MRVAWCTAHRGVMRISHFEPPPQHFYYPCPRCGSELNQMVKWQWDSKGQGREEPWRKGHHNLCDTHRCLALGCPILNEPSYTSYQDWVEQQNGNIQEPTNIQDSIAPESELDCYIYPPSREKYWDSSYTPTGTLCSCCNFFSVRPEVDLCGWCVDCPTKYCDVPNKFKTRK